MWGVVPLISRASVFACYGALVPLLCCQSGVQVAPGERTEQIGHTGQKERIDTAGRKVDDLAWDFHRARSPVPRHTGANFFCNCVHMLNAATREWSTRCDSSSENNAPIISQL